MGIGLEITNDNGSKQVVDTAPFLMVERRIRVDNMDFRESERVDVTAVKVIAKKPDDGYGMTLVANIAGNGNVDPFTGLVMMQHVRGKGEVFVFDKTKAESTANYGLEVYNEIGVIQYSSNQQPLRILDFISMDNIRAHGDTVGGRRRYWSKSYPGKQVAVITSRYPIWYSSGYLMTVAMYRRGDTYSIEEIREQTWTQSGSQIEEEWNYYAIVIDVSRY